MTHELWELKQRQSLPLDAKIEMTKHRIREWYDYFDGNVYVSFSGGKDSTVLLHIARQLFTDIEAVFVNTGLEYPEIQQFVKTFDNVTILRPKMRFDEVIKTYGYPFISKEVSECIYQAKRGSVYSYRLDKLNGTAKDKNGNKSIFNLERYKPLLDVDFNLSNLCCNIMKKHPAKTFAKQSAKMPITAQMACESKLREQMWLRSGCNAFDRKSPISNPMSFWTNQDVLKYIYINKLPIASVYGDIVPYFSGFEYYNCFFDDCEYRTTGCDRTGCIFCGFGAHLDTRKGGTSRFIRLKQTHPKQYDYCMGGGGYDTDGFWKPTKNGLGMAHCIDELNKLYSKKGKPFIEY